MKKYIEAELEVIAFDAEDVIATSRCHCYGDTAFGSLDD